MKKLLYITILAASFALYSCGEDFLVQDNLYEASNESYYSNPEEIGTALIAAYACLPNNSGSQNATLVANLMSDDCFGGGGTNDIGFQDIASYKNSTPNKYSEQWTVNYQGILRTNMIISRFDNAKYKDEAQKNQDLGEAHFLRAYFNFRLAQLFGRMPLLKGPEPVNYPKAEVDDIFAFIGADLKTAIELMPATNYTSISTDRLGHATKWAAEGLMARAFLFYTGKYNKTEIVLEDGSSITKNDVITWVDDCVANSGHGLIPDFRNLWPYAYANTTYKYAIDNNLQWIGEDGKNIETVFAIKYSPYGGWNAPNKLSYSNQLALYMGVRTGNSNVYQDFGQGWGGGPVNPQLWDSFEPGDLRKEGSILNVKDPNEGEIFTTYKFNGDNTMHETGLWTKKYTSIKVNGNGMYFAIYGNQSNPQLWNMQDEVLIRFADVLLMGAELGSSKAQEYFDRVRTRAGLASKPVSLDAIKQERRHELALEGLRYYDLLRWHDEEAALGAVKNVPVKNVDLDDTYTKEYRSETEGFLPIPETQVTLSKGVLLQNPGWE